MNIFFKFVFEVMPVNYLLRVVELPSTVGGSGLTYINKTTQGKYMKNVIKGRYTKNF